MERAAKYNAIKELPIGEQIHEVTAYAAPPEDTTKGVIHNIPASDSDEDISRSLVYKRNPTILQARRMGRTNSVVIVFEGEAVPYYVYYRGAEYRCYLHKKKHEICETCGRLGHRTDVCPSPENKICRGCGTKNPQENHNCDPKCVLCGRDHQTGDKKCRQRYQMPFLLRKRQWEKKKLFEQKTRGDREHLQNQRNVGDTGSGILKHGAEKKNTEDLGRDRSGSFPRLPYRDNASGHGGDGNENRSGAGDTHGSAVPDRRSSRSTSRKRNDSRSRSRSRSKSKTRLGNSEAQQKEHRQKEEPQQNKVSWAAAISHGSTQQHIHINNQRQSDQQSEITKIRKMLEIVMAENRALKAELLSLKRAKAPTPTGTTDEGVEMECTGGPDSHRQTDTTEASLEGSSPPTRRRATIQSKQVEATDSKPHQGKYVGEELLDTRLHHFEGRIENLFAKFAESVNARIMALENTRFCVVGSGQIGPIKTTKPYARPSVAENTRINLESAQHTNHGQ